MRTTVFAVASLTLCLTFLTACSEDTSLFPNTLVCSADSDCDRGSVCNRGFCVRPELDAGTSDTAAGSDATATGEDAATGTDTGSTDDAGACTPDCSARQCGTDGCGGSCGTCGGGSVCGATGMCESEGSAGDTCSEVLTCINGCGQDQACGQACFAAGSPTGQAQFSAVSNCVSTNCSDVDPDDFSSCQQDFCSDELSTCSGVASGSNTCAQVFDCVLTCSEQTCADACYAGGTTQARSQANALALCASDACAGATSLAEFRSCAETNCGGDYATCYP